MTPFQGINRVTSPFGPRISPTTGKQQHHNGQDIVTTGDWTVRECTGGLVLRVSSDQWRGKYVDVQTAPGVFERYQHLERIFVQVGQAVPQGTPLGKAGSTGDSTGRHLHFEVQKEGRAVAPAAWSGVPNQKGSHPGNNNLDGREESEVYVKIGPVSAGDRQRCLDLAADMGVQASILQE